MYRAIVRQLVRRAFRHLSRGEYGPVVNQFSTDSVFCFEGDHALGGERHGREQAEQWFRDMLRLFPGIRLTTHDVVVNGWPWKTVVATRFSVEAPSPDGNVYRNEGMQFLRLRWGRIVEDRLFEDTQELVAELERRAQQPAAQAAPVA
jgi:ketosteroid isomerase-like protein